METIEIDKDRKLNPGDVVLMHFNAPGATWVKATECAMIESALERRREFTIIGIDYWQPEKVIFKVEVQETNPVIVTAAYIAGAVLAVTIPLLALGWMFEKAELLLKTPAAKTIGIGVLIVAGIVLLSALKGKI